MLKDYGYGGVVTNVRQEDGFTANRKNLEEFNGLVELLKKNEMSYWLYDEIADYWKDQTSPVPVYQAFFDSYQTVGFDTSTQQLVGLVNELAANSNETVKQQMMTAFLRSSSYELGFWQMAYTHQTWADPADN